MVIGTEYEERENDKCASQSNCFPSTIEVITNRVTIESLESPVPSCLLRLSPMIDPSVTIRSPLGSVIGKFLVLTWNL